MPIHLKESEVTHNRKGLKPQQSSISIISLSSSGRMSIILFLLPVIPRLWGVEGSSSSWALSVEAVLIGRRRGIEVFYAPSVLHRQLEIVPPVPPNSQEVDGYLCSDEDPVDDTDGGGDVFRFAWVREVFPMVEAEVNLDVSQCGDGDPQYHMAPVHDPPVPFRDGFQERISGSTEEKLDHDEAEHEDAHPVMGSIVPDLVIVDLLVNSNVDENEAGESGAKGERLEGGMEGEPATAAEPTCNEDSGRREDGKSETTEDSMTQNLSFKSRPSYMIDGS
jgi:hypothetical protein